MMFFWTEKRANKVYDVLVQECGASEGDQRQSFVYHFQRKDMTEWRFCGALGFGGKFWVQGGRMYVNCYNEDETPERRAMIEAANKRLVRL